MTRQPFTFNVRCCARCGQDHLDILARPFTRMPEDGLNYFAICPVLDEPILVYQPEVIDG